MPASLIPSSPPTRLPVTSGRSAHGSTWLCSELTLPNAARILPTLVSSPPGSDVKRDEAFLDVDALLAERDEEVGARVRIDDGLKGRFGFVQLERRHRAQPRLCPAAPRKSPITAMSGLNTFEPPTADP